MVRTHWHVRLTLESSEKAQVLAEAEAECRSASNYIGRLIRERKQAEKSETTA